LEPIETDQLPSMAAAIDGCGPVANGERKFLYC
jgi:hypothetical protein